MSFIPAHKIDQAQPRLCATLSDLENALLWCMRAWVIGYCRQRHVSDRIGAVFATLGAAAAAIDLNGFMSALSQGAVRTIEINCVCYPEVSDHERLLLDVFALQQREDCEDAYATMAAFVTERAAIAACDHAHRLAFALLAAGKTLPLPSVAALGGLAPQTGVAWGSNTLH